jgi:ABC-type multidrug transport system ATPase subunit
MTATGTGIELAMGAPVTTQTGPTTPGLTRQARARAAGECPEPGHCVLRAEEVRKSFHRGLPPRRRTFDVLNGASLMVCRGELIGLVGENGSGKSTLMQIMVGLRGRDGGSVWQEGRVGYCPQVPMVWDKLTVDEHFELFARAYGLDDQMSERAVGRLLEELQFERYRRYRVEELSGGTRQKLNLALAVMHEPHVLLLDEPYSGFDWETYVRFWEMSERRRDQGMGILIVSHLLAERERLDRVYELRDGKTVEG